MVIGGTIKCKICEEEIWLKVQVGKVEKTKIRIGCPSCATVLRGKFQTARPTIEFENADFSYDIGDFNKQIYAVSTELPIVNKTVNTKSIGLTPYLGFVGRYGLDGLQKALKNYLPYREKWEKEGSNFRDLINLSANKKYDLAQNFIKNNFINGLSGTLDKDFQATSFLVNQVLLEFTKLIAPGKYKPYYQDRLLIKKTLKKIETDKVKLNSILVSIRPYLDLEKEFNNALKLITFFLSNFELFMPVVILSYVDGFEKEFKDEFLMTTFEYDELKDLYVDLFELLSRISLLYIAMYNYGHYGDVDDFRGLKNCSNLEGYFKLSNGRRKDIIAEIKDMEKYFRFLLDSQLRNGIGHFKTEYDAINQVIKYYPFNDQKRMNKHKEKYLVDFVYHIYLMILATIDFVNFVARLNRKLK